MLGKILTCLFVFEMAGTGKLWSISHPLQNLRKLLQTFGFHNLLFNVETSVRYKIVY